MPLSTTPGASASVFAKLRPSGMLDISAELIVAPVVVEERSITGALPTTSIVSETPGVSITSTRTRARRRTSMFWRSAVV